ncbi:rubredoxin [Candidatus Pacearchaeota archaeon CG10_big_fil_rev_8_21_14_0_10_31_9]|nr:MAG: rubredoxin [Candidatus Pacearchaeota archaeon CG10_big_fil_rev_8_21_14_0_10_31_9]PIZ82555.1 MAG: rubredoxin [Candidatus Pacearchaeota archaeon CG_4_10_14_0_2_um_filter_05_32_18]
MAKFRCKRCNYSFSMESRTTPKVCPNCGNTNCIGREKSASELLDETEE